MLREPCGFHKGVENPHMEEANFLYASSILYRVGDFLLALLTLFLPFLLIILLAIAKGFLS